MDQQGAFDVIIIGGSFAGLSAALSLGRALRKVLVIDSGNPCNRRTPHSHNFLTNDGKTPQEITQTAREQLFKYQTVSFKSSIVADVIPKDGLFEVITKDEAAYSTRKVVFATGIVDTIPIIEGFAECWGISVLHCPYCHGYEVRNKKMGVLGNGDQGFEIAKTIAHWTNDLTLFTNGTSTLSPELLLLNKHNILVVENDIAGIEHNDGYIKRLLFKDAEAEELTALFTQLPFIQQCNIPEKLGCTFTDKGFIEVSRTMETSVPGIYAAGDCLTLFRSVANAVAAGNKAGAMINKALIEEDF
jgi:thioredoxin reductase